jgi:phenylacetic acid degradation operon negative regulatory protein
MRLTEKGRLHALGGRDPETCWATPWDGKWRLVLFDIPEREMNLRTNLRRHLLARRFGYLQNSVWVSPHPLGLENALFKGSEINAERLLTLDAVPGTGEKNSDIARAAWDFKSINKNYAEVIKLLEACPGAQVPKSVKGTPPLRRWLVAVRQAWRSAMALDPLLPRALCPPDYLGEKAWKLRSKKLAALARQLEGVLES